VHNDSQQYGITRYYWGLYIKMHMA